MTRAVRRLVPTLAPLQALLDWGWAHSSQSQPWQGDHSQFTLKAKPLSRGKSMVTICPHWPGLEGFLGMWGCWSSHRGKFHVDWDELVALPWEAGRVYVTSLGGKSPSAGAQVEQVCPPPRCRGVATRASPGHHQQVASKLLPSAGGSSPCQVRHVPAQAHSILHTGGLMPRDLVSWATGIPKRPPSSCDVGRDSSWTGVSLPQVTQ